jgi:triphosphoribosyl-dephospho-CoA synthase
MKTPGEITKLVQMACLLEVCAPKPGNVSRHHDFADTSMIDFLLSAIAIGPAFEKAATHPIGEIVYEAIKATQQKANANTNLGIVFLLAPLARACYGVSNLNGIRGNLRAILKNLSVEDAQLAYAAIRLAKAGGMGKVPEWDISEEPSIPLLQAMKLAQGRDSIAREYATGFAITFEIGLPALTEAAAKGMDYSNAIVQAYLTILSQIPDTLIARKKGMEAAREVSLHASEVLRQGGVFTENGRTGIREMDRKLRDPGHTLNPGTTADLTTAAIFLMLFECEMSNVLSC